MKVWKLKNPIDGNFKQLIIQMIFDGVAHKDVTAESSKACKKFFTSASNGFNDPNLRLDVNLLKTHDLTLNWDADVIFTMPGKQGLYIQKNIEIAIEGGFERDGDIEPFGTLEFRINPKTGLLIAIGWEEIEL